MPGVRVARGFREDDGEGLRGGLARNLRLTFQEPDFLVLPSLQKPTHTKNEISRGVMGAAGGGAKETQTGRGPARLCLLAFYVVLRFRTLALPRIPTPTQWHLAALSTGLRSTTP